MIFKNKRPTIGLALGAGGARGYAHIGVLKVLQQHGIPIDIITGSSAGAIIGSMYALTQDIELIETTMMKLSGSKVASILFDPSFNQGFASGTKLRKFLDEAIGEKEFSDTTIPFAAVATDLHTGNPVTLSQGKLGEAIHASAAMPLLFKPIEYGDHLLTDGGVSTPVPVQQARAMGADIVIAVNLYNEYYIEDYTASLGLSTMFLQSFNIMLHHLAQEHMKQADVIISPPLKHLRWRLILSEQEKRDIMALGEKTTVDQMDFLHAFIEKKSKRVLNVPQIPKLTIPQVNLSLVGNFLKNPLFKS